MKIKPIGRNILVERTLSEDKAGDIIIPDTVVEQSLEATVVEVGSEGMRDENGLIKFLVKVGDTVLLSKYEGNEVELDNKKYMIVEESDILAII